MPVLKPAARRVPPGRAALILAIATMVTAGCGAATPQAAGTVPAAAAVRPAAGAPTPPVFAGTLVPARGGTAWPAGVFSSATGQLLRQLTGPPAGASDLVLSVRGGWVYFAAWLRDGVLSGVWRVPLAGGPARLVQAGAITYVLSPDGRMAASLVTADHGRTTEIAVTSLVTGHRSTIVMATSRPGYGMVGVTTLAWAPDDTHLAAEVVYAAFASDVMVFNARTARSIRDGRTVPCPGRCAAKFPAYLRTGTLTYVTEQLSPNGTSPITLVSWAGGKLTRLVTMRDGPGPLPLLQGESTTPQGAAIWVLQTQTRAGARLAWRSTIWRWPGGKPVRIRTLPPVTQPPAGYELTDIAW
jgi:hypothetical protein